MKKILTLGVVALVLITMSSCQFNLFAAFDKIEIPSAADLSSKAGSDPDGFVSDVEEYVDSGSITEDNADAVVSALVAVYSDPTADIPTQQKAAVLVGEIAISSDPKTSAVVNGVISAVSDTLTTGIAIDPDTLIASIFEGITAEDIPGILADLDKAALAYADFAANLGTDPDMTSGEVGDMAQLAVISLIVSDLKIQAGEAGLISAITDGTPLVQQSDGSPILNPLDLTDGTDYAAELDAILTFAGLDIGI